MGLRTPNLTGEDRRPTLEERESEAAVHLLVKHIKGWGSRRPDQGRRGRRQGVIVITAGSSGPPARAIWVGVDNPLSRLHAIGSGSDSRIEVNNALYLPAKDGIEVGGGNLGNG